MRGTGGASLRRRFTGAWLAGFVLVATACGAGGATEPPPDTTAPADVIDHAEPDLGAACTIAADCPQDACKLAACLGGRCTTANRPDGTACDDGLACTTGDACRSGQCLPQASTCAPACETDADCPPVDASNLCLGRAPCVEGACRADRALPVTCGATASTCRVAECDPASGHCADHAAPDGTACDDDDPCSVTSCLAGVCAETAVSPCECRADADCALFDQPCAERHGCNLQVFPHVCQVVPGSALACDDPDPVDCLGRACDPVKNACADVPLADGTACDDGDPCSVTSCVAGACEATGPSPCECQADTDCPDDGDLCNGVPVCDRTAWPYVCSVDPESVPAACDPSDDTFCRHAVCDPSTGACVVVPRATGQACEPDLPCVIDAICQQGTCQGVPRDCDDQSPCTDDACHPITGECTHEPVQATVYCEDSTPCNDGGQCVAGLCLGSPRSCDDQNECTVDACDKAEDACVATPLTDVPCDDLAPCTLDDTCQAGQCVGEPRVCDDGNACTADACVEATGSCEFSSLVGQPCDDGNACTLGDACDAIGACAPTAVTTCKAKGQCWHEVCNPEPGNGRCEVAADPGQAGDLCSASDPCAAEGRCLSATCEPTLWRGDCCQAAADCDDGDACTVDDCAAHGCTHEAVVCDPTETGCAFTPCEAGACAAPVGLGSRRVLFERAPGDADWWQGAYEYVEGSFVLSGGAIRSSGLAPSASLTLPPVRIPRGTSTLRLRVVEPSEIPTTLGLTASDASVFPTLALTVRAVDLDDQPGFDVLIPLSASYDRTRRVRLALSDAGLALGRVQVVHHGGEGCPGSVETSAGMPYQDTLVYATACARPDGSILSAWLEAKTGTEAHVAWAVRDVSGVWGERHVFGDVISSAGSTFRVACLALDAGWALAFGDYVHDGGPGSHLAILDRNGVAGSSGPFPGLTGASPVLARLSEESFVLAYARHDVSDEGWDVFVKEYRDDLFTVGYPHKVNETGQGDQRAPTLAVSGDRVLVAWEEAVGTDPVRLKRRLLSTDMAPVTAESMFAGSADAAYRYPSAMALPSAAGERFLVVYEANGKPSDAGRGVYRSEIDGTGAEVVNEVGLSVATAGDQMVPFASAIPGGAAVVWASNDAGPVDLVLARVDGTGVHPSVRLASGVTGFGAVLPSWPGALEALFWRADAPAIARLGLTCDAGLTDCSSATPALCIDADAYVPATPACSGEGCSSVCP